MRYLRQSTQQTRVLGPAVAIADYSRATSVAYNQAGMDFNIMKNGTKVDITPAVGAGDEYWVHVANGYYAFTFSASDTDTLGSLMVTVDTTLHTMPPHSFSVLSAAVYDVLFGSTALSTYAGGDTSGVSTLLTSVGTPVNTGGTATIAAILGDPANSSLVARMTAVPAAVWNVLTSTLATTGSIGKRLVDFVTTLVYSAPPAAAPSASDNAAAVRTNLTTELADVVATAGHISADYGSTEKTAIDAIGTPVNTGGSATLAAILGNPSNSDLVTRISDIDGDLGEPVGATISADIAAVKSSVGTPMQAGSYTAPPAVGDIADAVCDEVITSGHTGAGKLATILNTIASNAADILTDTGTTLDARLTLVRQILQNRVETDPLTGIMTVYDDDNTTPLYTANVYEDIAGSSPYAGHGANRRNRLA